MTRRLFLAVPLAAVAGIDPDEPLRMAANSFAEAYREWAGYRNTISPESRDFAAKESRLWTRQRSAYGRLERAHG